jgi:hypothetical protein
MATIEKSPDLNTKDTAVVCGKRQEFSLDDANKLDTSVILLYIYFLPRFPMHGFKVGMTKCRMGETFWHAINSRIQVQEHELALTPEQYKKYGWEREVVYWGICLDTNNESFTDYHVHEEIKHFCAGLVEKEQEWFENVPLDELIAAFDACREKSQKKVFEPRKEQRACIDALKGYFQKNPEGSRFLLNCKMRFGKSFTTYKYCEEANLNKILILTFVPAVESSWKDDLLHIKKDYLFYTDENIKKKDFSLGKLTNPFVLFLSLQNYLGKDSSSNEVKEKIKKLQGVDFDLVILDEYHFGAWNSRTQETFEDVDPEYQKEASKVKNVIEKFKIKTKETICLSGTPFKALETGEFTSENSFSYSYFDEQKNKYPNPDDLTVVNPAYAQFPDIKIFGYNMSRLFGHMTNQIFSNDKLLNKKYFSLNTFFQTEKDLNASKEAVFVYQEAILQWLEIIKGRSTFGGDFPFSNIHMLSNNKHSLWLMPGVNSCKAMADLLSKDEYFSNYIIINLSQSKVGAGVGAYNYLMDGIKAAENTGAHGSIAITVNKLTLGVTVKQWSSIFVLKDLASPEQYFQSIFRIQTPLVKDGVICKKNGYVYDFNIDRAAALLLRYAQESNRKSLQKMEIAQLIVKYLPIFINGNMSEPISESVFYELASFGDTSGKPLSRRITDTSRTTRILDDSIIAEMLNDNEVSDVIKRVFAHAKFSKSKTGTIPDRPAEDGFDSKIAKDARDKGYGIGMGDSSKIGFLDDNQAQEEFTNAVSSYIHQFCPQDFDENRKTVWENGFKQGYESGVNVPIRSLQCGKEDGVKFVEQVRKRLGQSIVYKDDTKNSIRNVVRSYLNDNKNIPEKYQGMLYKRWYKDSFEKAVIHVLKPEIKDKERNSVEDADNVMKHILARLFEFLYISVYRETTFSEIFQNANPEVFLEAVGITKKDFTVLNKYHVFQEDVLNNDIHDFFVNESLGEKLDLSDPKVQEKYRNSFDWFGYGIVKE